MPCQVTQVCRTQLLVIQFKIKKFHTSFMQVLTTVVETSMSKIFKILKLSYLQQHELKSFCCYNSHEVRLCGGYTGLFISPSGISELDCATSKTDTAERSMSIGRESLQVFFFVLGALAYFQVPPLGGSRDEKWRSQ